jgi:hypothetical protein
MMSPKSEGFMAKFVKLFKENERYFDLYYFEAKYDNIYN